MAIGDFCHAWQADDLEIIPKLEDQTKATDHSSHFFIKFKVEFHYPPALPLYQENDILLVQFDLASMVSVRHFWAQCKGAPHEERLSWGEISDMLTKIRIPLQKQPFMLHKISTCAEEMANAIHNEGLKVLPMMVSVSILADYFCYDLQDSTTLAVRENPGVANKLMIARPAAGEVPEMEALAKKMVPAGDGREKVSVTKCMICLGDDQAGSEIWGLPCSHYYHRNCLLRWLKICNFCPLCL